MKGKLHATYICRVVFTCWMRGTIACSISLSPYLCGEEDTAGGDVKIQLYCYGHVGHITLLSSVCSFMWSHMNKSQDAATSLHFVKKFMHTWNIYKINTIGLEVWLNLSMIKFNYLFMTNLRFKTYEWDA